MAVFSNPFSKTETLVCPQCKAIEFEKGYTNLMSSCTIRSTKKENPVIIYECNQCGYILLTSNGYRKVKD